ncbi:hypothetical protein PCE1_004988 [Barthelona sp. PCE]
MVRLGDVQTSQAHIEGNELIVETGNKEHKVEYEQIFHNNEENLVAAMTENLFQMTEDGTNTATFIFRHEIMRNFVVSVMSQHFQLLLSMPSTKNIRFACVETTFNGMKDNINPSNRVRVIEHDDKTVCFNNVTFSEDLDVDLYNIIGCILQRMGCIFEVRFTHLGTEKLFKIVFLNSLRLPKTNPTGQSFREAVSISISIPSFGEIVKSLLEKRKYVPWRNSAVTHYIKDSFTLYDRWTYVCVTSFAQIEETVAMLKYSTRLQILANRSLSE